jgi:hypothetical protein
VLKEVEDDVLGELIIGILVIHPEGLGPRLESEGGKMQISELSKLTVIALETRKLNALGNIWHPLHPNIFTHAY